MRHRDPHANRGDVHDAPRTDAPHVRQHSEDRKQRPPEMRRHRVLEVRDGHVLERPDLNDPGVVDENVYRTVAGNDALDRLVDFMAPARLFVVIPALPQCSRLQGPCCHR